MTPEVVSRNFGIENEIKIGCTTPAGVICCPSKL